MDVLFLFEVAAEGLLDKGVTADAPLLYALEYFAKIPCRFYGLRRHVDEICALLGCYTQRRMVIPYRRLRSTLHNAPEECKYNFT